MRGLIAVIGLIVIVIILFKMTGGIRKEKL